MNLAEKIKSESILVQIGTIAGETETYVVGGYVRDLIMGKSSKDIDVVCVGSGIDLAKKVASSLPGRSHLNVFKNFGTAQLKIR